MLDLARSNVPDATYQLGDINELKAEQFSVDAVVSFFALIHVDRIHHRRVFETIRTYLGLSGLLLMTTGRSEWEGKEDFLGTEMTWSDFDRSTYRQLIEESGFAIIIEDEHRGNAFDDEDCHPIFLAQVV